MDSDGLVKNAKGVPFVILHQYDRVPEWTEYISKKYGIIDPVPSESANAPKYFTYKT
jgi:hypothetical protein